MEKTFAQFRAMKKDIQACQSKSPTLSWLDRRLQDLLIAARFTWIFKRLGRGLLLWRILLQDMCCRVITGDQCRDQVISRRCDFPLTQRANRV
jgi:hypothetical protein